MIINKTIIRLLLAATLSFPYAAGAVLTYPALDIQDRTGDSGASLTTTTFGIDATAFAIITDSGAISIPDAAFTLSGTGFFDGFMGMFSGSLTVGSDLLSGTFTDLAVIDLGSGLQFVGNITYTGGSLMGDTTGRIEGVTSDSSVIAKLNSVIVPVSETATLSLLALGLVLIGAYRIRNRRSL